MKTVLKNTISSRFTPIFCCLLGTFVIVLFALPDLILSPNSTVLTSTGDGLKSYYVFDYHMKFDSSFADFKGLNYPYGDSYLYTDGFPLLNFVIRLLPFLQNYSVGIIHISLAMGLVLTSYFLFLILNHYTKNKWLSVIASLAIFILQPQFFRLFGHLSLAYSCCIPMGWYFAIKYLNCSNKWLWVVLLFVTNIFWYFTHGYLGLMLTFFLILIFILENKVLRQWKRVIQIASFTLVPLIIFYSLSKWSEDITDRTKEPFGIFEYQANWKSVFLPTEGPIHNELSSFIEMKETNWEGYAYIGVVSLICIPIILFFALLKLMGRTKKEIIPRELLLALLSSFVLLLYSFGFPLNQFPKLLDILEPLKQFRALGRFAWPFYFVTGISSFVFLIKLYIQTSSNSKKYLLATCILVGGSISFVEAIPRFENIQPLAKSPFKIENLSKDQKEIIHFINSNKSQFQCILPLPWFHVGSELFAKEPNENAMSNAMILSTHTGIPIYSSLMGRTSLSQTQDFFRSLGSELQKKNRSVLFSKKDILVWYNNLKLFDEDERELYTKTKLLFKNKFGELRSLTINDLFLHKKPSTKDAKKINQITRKDFLFEDYIQQNGTLKSKVSQYNVFANFKPSELLTDHWYEISFDYYWIGKKNLDNVFRMEYVDKGKVNWFYERTISSFTDQQHNHVRVRAVFKTQKFDANYNFFLFGGEKKRQEYFIDNLLIRPMEINTLWTNQNGIKFLNSFPL